MTIALTDTRIFVGPADISRQSNKVELSPEVAELDATAFAGDGWAEVAPGLRSGRFSVEGYFAAGDQALPDDRTWSDLGTTPVHTVCPQAPSIGGLAWLFQGLRSKYTVGGQVGELARFSGEGATSGPIVRGQLLHLPGTARTATGAGDGVQIGAVDTGLRMWAALHVLSVAGDTPSITVTLQSDEDDDWDTPTDRLIFDAATARGAQFASVAGEITDEWWRVSYAISGSTPSFLFVVSAGISAK